MLGPGVVGYSVSRSIDARLTLATRSVAIGERKPGLAASMISGRGCQYAAKAYYDYLAADQVSGSGPPPRVFIDETWT
jgi:putative transposase